MLCLRKERIVAESMHYAKNKYLVYMATVIFGTGDEVFMKIKYFARSACTWFTKYDIAAAPGHIHLSIHHTI